MLWCSLESPRRCDLMSTHNIGFNKEMTKITFQLSSNIIKYNKISGGLSVFTWHQHGTEQTIRHTFLQLYTVPGIMWYNYLTLTIRISLLR